LFASMNFSASTARRSVRVLAGLGLFEARHLTALVRERREVAPRRAGLVAGDVHVEPLQRRLEPGPAEVPLADHPGGVAALLERLRERDLVEREFVRDRRPLEALIGHILAARNPVGDPAALRVLPREDADAGGRAHRARRIEVGEPQPVLRHLVDVRGLVERAAVAPEVALAHVVDDDEDNVGLVGGVQQRTEGEQRESEQDAIHGSTGGRERGSEVGA
jgi:hypothetical protein